MDLVPFTSTELRALQEEALVEVKETLALELKERKINPLFIPLVNAYLENKSIPEIAQATGLNVLEVSLILEKPEIKNYMNQMITSYGYLNKIKRIELVTKVIDKIIADAEEYDTPMTKKDLLDWLKLVQNEVSISLQGAPKTQVNFNQKIENNMASLIQDLLITEE